MWRKSWFWLSKNYLWRILNRVTQIYSSSYHIVFIYIIYCVLNHVCHIMSFQRYLRANNMCIINLLCRLVNCTFNLNTPLHCCFNGLRRHSKQETRLPFTPTHSTLWESGQSHQHRFSLCSMFVSVVGGKKNHLGLLKHMKRKMLHNLMFIKLIFKCKCFGFSIFITVLTVKCWMLMMIQSSVQQQATCW